MNISELKNTIKNNWPIMIVLIIILAPSIWAILSIYYSQQITELREQISTQEKLIDFLKEQLHIKELQFSYERTNISNVDKPSDDLTFTYTYTPPPEPGDVYAVIDKKKKPTIYLAYEWGPAKNSGTVNIADKDGVILHLNHSYYDSFPLTIKTDGNKESIIQYQNGKFPKQLFENYEKVFW